MEALIFDKKGIAKAARWLLEKTAGRRKLAFYGEMGAGKTTFIGALCRAIGAKGPTASPTFSLINQYSFLNEKGRREAIHHLDLYRLKTLHEAIDIGIEELLENGDWCLVEWPQLIEPIFPEGILIVKIEAVDEARRRITV